MTPPDKELLFNRVIVARMFTAERFDKLMSRVSKKLDESDIPAFENYMRAYRISADAEEAYLVAVHELPDLSQETAQNSTKAVNATLDATAPEPSSAKGKATVEINRDLVRETYGVDYMLYCERMANTSETPKPYEEWLDSICTVETVQNSLHLSTNTDSSTHH